MKQIILLCLFILSITFASAQSGKMRFNAYGSYVFDDGFDVYNDANTYYNGKIEGGLQWGAGFEYVIHDYYSMELIYLNKSSDVPSNFKFGLAEPTRKETFDLSHNYILLGFNRLQASTSGKIEGYGGFLAGIVIADAKSPSTGKSGNNTDFTWGGRIGLNYWAGAKVGIKVQAQILTASKVTGGEMYYGYWGPVYLDSYSTMWQFGLGAGLVFKLGK